MNETTDTTDEVLRDRLAAADPAKRASINPIRNQLMERIMTTTHTTTRTTAATTASGNADHTDSTAPARRWRLPALGGAAAAAVAAVVGVAALGGGSNPATATPLELNGGGGDAMASCLPFSVDILDDMVTAFEGTVTAVDGPTVMLDIDRWYHDGTGSAAQTVIVNAPEGMEALIGGIPFETGGQYLVSADAEGNVAYCGYSAPATNDMRASFAEAFPA